MIDHYANKRMSDYMPGVWEAMDEVALPSELQAVVESGFVEQGDCVLLQAEFEGCKSVSPEDFPDLTGHECLVNHVHVDDYAAPPLAPAAIAFMTALRHALKTEFPRRRFQAIAGVNDTGCTVRFHCLRKGERWLAEDLEAYGEEGILVLEF